MPVTIVPPGRNASAAALQKIFEDTQDKLIREILRKRSKGYVDYAEVAALERVRKTLQKMVKGAEKYVPLAVEHEFYKRPESAEAYRNARESINPGRTRAVEILSDNLLGEVEEMAETAYQSTASKLFLVGRAQEDIFREAALTSAVEASAAGRGSLTTVNEIIAAIQNTGITAFVDKAGHEWNLKAYGSMAVRTTVRQAQVAAVLTENQHDLYKIINTGVPCRWCAAYGGRVYSKSGMNKNYPPLTAAFGRIDTSGSDSIYNSFLNIHPNCLVPGGLVLAEGVVSESRRLYSGKVVTLKTSAGNEITVTPNHPILTDRGFVAADLLHEGDKIIEATGEYARFFGQAPNDINIPTAVDKIFHALVETGGGSACCVKSTPEQFHGDGTPNGEVDIVFTDRLGRGVSNAMRIKPVTEKDFPTAHFGRVKFLADCTLFKVGKRPLFTPDGIMRRFGFVSGVERNAKNLHDLADSERANTAPFRNLGVCKALLMKGAECFKHFSMLVKVLLGNNAVGLSSASTLGANDPGFSFGKSNGALGDTELLRNLRTGETVVDERLKHFTGHNALVVSTLTHKGTSFYNGYVYNFETEHSFYVYNNIVTHNCLCTLVEYHEEDHSPEEVEKERLYSDPARRPFDLDYRTKAVKEAYEQKERNRAVYRANVKQYRKYLESGVPGMPKTFQTFLKHKRLNDDKYREWMAAYRKADKPVKAKPVMPVPKPKPVKPAVQYKQFESGEAANGYFGQRPPRSLRRENREEYDRRRAEYESSAFGTWSSGLAVDEQASIANYSGDAYSGINGLLRKQMTEKMVDAWDANERLGVRDMINNLDSAIERFELRDPIRVYRTCERDVLESLKAQPGTTFRDNGYVSTSALSKKVASGNVVMEIDVPPGVGHGAWINPLSGAENEEYEFLMPRGSEFKVKGVSERDGDTVIRMEFIGSQKQPIEFATREEVIDRWKRLGIYDEDMAKKI